MEGDEPLAELLRQINRFVDDLEHSLNDRIDLHVECDNAILCGMGGSAISGDVVADLALSLRYSDRVLSIRPADVSKDLCRSVVSGNTRSP